MIHNFADFLNPFYVYDSCFKYRCRTKGMSQLETFDFDYMTLENFRIMLKNIYSFVYDKNMSSYMMMSQLGLSLDDYYFELLKNIDKSSRENKDMKDIKYTKEWFQNRIDNEEIGNGHLVRIDMTYFYVYNTKEKGMIVQRIK